MYRVPTLPFPPGSTTIDFRGIAKSNKLSPITLSVVLLTLAGRPTTVEYYSLHFKELLDIAIFLQCPLLAQFVIMVRLDYLTAPHILVISIKANLMNYAEVMYNFLYHELDITRHTIDSHIYKSNGNIVSKQLIIFIKPKVNCEFYTFRAAHYYMVFHDFCHGGIVFTSL